MRKRKLGRPYSQDSQRLKILSDILVFSSIGLVLCGTLIYTLFRPTNESNPLALYGVYYEKTYGQFDSFQNIQFFWKRDKKIIKGPLIAGDDLDVEYLRADPKEVPEIFIVSKDDSTEHATLKLNFNDPSKPDFEIVENHSLKIDYAPLGYHWL
jgi:hypothetical protein